MRRELVNDTMRRWECDTGVAFLRDIGVRPGDSLVDFGCRVGHYSIPAALLVGDSGQVYAIDKDRQPLDQLATKARRLAVRNIRLVEACGRPAIDVESHSVGVVLLYDVLHYFTGSQRRELLSEAFRVLVPGGMLSVYPKHTAEDWPSKEFKDLHVADVRREIQACRFRFSDRHEGILSHDDGLVEGYVLNFRKRRAK